jgi:hypothetical protein
VNVLRKETRTEVERLLKDGVGIRQVARSTRTDKDTICRYRDSLIVKGELNERGIVRASERDHY